jgi:NAD(P)-dependent dehydrogenase (short-subunit alcohol dehydrogenase family)
LVFVTGIAARRPGVSHPIAALLAAALPAVTANLAVEMAPIRVNLIAAGFVDTPLSTSSSGTSWTSAGTSWPRRSPSGASSSPRTLPPRRCTS